MTTLQSPSPLDSSRLVSNKASSYSNITKTPIASSEGISPCKNIDRWWFADNQKGADPCHGESKTETATADVNQRFECLALNHPPGVVTTEISGCEDINLIDDVNGLAAPTQMVIGEAHADLQHLTPSLDNTMQAKAPVNSRSDDNFVDILMDANPDCSSSDSIIVSVETNPSQLMHDYDDFSKTYIPNGDWENDDKGTAATQNTSVVPESSRASAPARPLSVSTGSKSQPHVSAKFFAPKLWGQAAAKKVDRPAKLSRSRKHFAFIDKALEAAASIGETDGGSTAAVPIVPITEVPRDIRKITDHQLVYVNLSELVEQMKQNKYSDAKIREIKTRRTKLKNRHSAKGSSIRKRQEYVALSQTNEQLIRAVDMLRKDNTDLASENATLKDQLGDAKKRTEEYYDEMNRYEQEYYRLTEIARRIGVVSDSKDSPSSTVGGDLIVPHAAPTVRAA